MDKVLEHRKGWETQNMLTVGRCIAQAALAREESRGVHFRSDFPEANDKDYLGHITLERTADGIREAFEPCSA
jgi:L-aspartate oxidase